MEAFFLHPLLPPILPSFKGQEAAAPKSGRFGVTANHIIIQWKKGLYAAYD
jgi:hypothetical protein